MARVRDRTRVGVQAVTRRKAVDGKARALLSDPDWARLKSIEAAAEAATSADERRVHLDALRDRIRALEARHGRRAALAAMRAALEPTPAGTRELFEGAYALAVEQSDDACALTCALALTRHFLETAPDHASARQWLERANRCSRGAAPEDLAELEALSTALPAPPPQLDWLEFDR